jgi:DNA-binding response OmpR family regulator
MAVLLIESHQPMLRAVQQKLQHAGFAVDVAMDGEQGHCKARTATYDVIILDVVLPKIDGLTLLRRWRRSGISAHVLVLTTRDSVADKVKVLDLGADDYLTKPFQWPELLARVRALLRRSRPLVNSVLRIEDLEIDSAARTVHRGGQSIFLTPREFALLQILARHRGKVVSRSMILEQLYADDGPISSNIVDVFIRNLRAKIDHGFDSPLIMTRYGMGYMLQASA